MEYRDASNYIKQLVKVLVSKELDVAVFYEKINYIRLAMERRSRGYTQSEHAVTYTFHRLEKFADGDPRVTEMLILADLARFENLDAFEAKP